MDDRFEHLALDLLSLVVEADADVAGVDESGVGGGNSVISGLVDGGDWNNSWSSNMMSVGGGDNRVSHWDSVVDQRSGDTLDNWSSLDSLDSGDNIVDIGQRSVDSRGGVEESRVSLGLGFSLGDSVDLLSLDHWDIVDTVDWETSVDMVSQGETRVDSSNMVGQGESVVDQGGGDSLDNWSGLDSLGDHWSSLDSGDQSLEQRRVLNIGEGSVDSSGQGSVDSRGGVEESWISLGLGLSISRSLSIVSVWVAISISIGSVSIIIWSQSISVVAIPGISISLGFSISRSLAIVSVSVWVAISISIGSVSIIIWSQTISVVAIVGISIGFRLGHGHGGESENYNELHLDQTVVERLWLLRGSSSFYTRSLLSCH